MTTATVREILTSKTLHERNDFKSIVENTINEMGQTQFFDEYFNIIREYRNEYLQFNSYSNSPTYYLTKPLLRPLTDYLSKKLNKKDIVQMIPADSVSVNSWETRNLLDSYVHEYAYNNTIPSLIGDPDEEEEIDINGTTYQYRYFLWVKEDDPNLQQANSREVITTTNFNTHLRSIFEGGWSLSQMLTFTIVNILPPIIRAAGLDINLRHRTYRNCIKYTLTNRNDLGRCIKHFINRNGDISIGNMNWASVATTPVHGLLRTTPYTDLNDFFKEPYYLLLNLVKCLTRSQQMVRHTLHHRFRRIAERQATAGPQKRFKWMNICEVLSTFSRDDLLEFAHIEQVLYPAIMTKRELCAELSKKFSERINKANEIKPKCFNQDSAITLEPVSDIPAEFFYAYTHNNKIYCDDIRQLVTHFRTELSQRRAPRHPLDRTPLSEKLVHLIFSEYEYLHSVTNNMESEPEEELPPQSVLSSKASTFSNLLLHHAPIQGFIDANESLTNRFISELREEMILRNNEITHINASRDLMDKKNRLLDILTLRINSDPRVDGVSQLAVNITSAYNTIFS